MAEERDFGECCFTKGIEKQLKCHDWHQKRGLWEGLVLKLGRNMNNRRIRAVAYLDWAVGDKIDVPLAGKEGRGGFSQAAEK